MLYFTVNNYSVMPGIFPGLPGLNQYYAGVKVHKNTTQTPRGDAISSLTLYQLNNCAPCNVDVWQLRLYQVTK